MSANLLIELLTEELPPKALRQLGEAFSQGILKCLVRAGLKDAGQTDDTRFFATPRRLAVLIDGVLDNAPDRGESRKLMPVKVAFDADGNPSAALLKRLDKEGASTEALTRAMEGNTEYAFLNRTITGATLTATRSSCHCSMRWRRRLRNCPSRR